jgi:hypothetical protein
MRLTTRFDAAVFSRGDDLECSGEAFEGRGDVLGIDAASAAFALASTAVRLQRNDASCCFCLLCCSFFGIADVPSTTLPPFRPPPPATPSPLALPVPLLPSLTPTPLSEAACGSTAAGGGAVEALSLRFCNEGLRL